MRLLPFQCVVCSKSVWPWQRVFYGGKFAERGHRDCTIRAEIDFLYRLWKVDYERAGIDFRRTDVEEMVNKYVQ